MPLDQYRAKRNFRVSPEPPGAARPRRARGAGLFFCVQKHLASHLHYDLRLEHDGVLLSWAVPKGPSLNPADKRLAMHVEDHPIEYGTFEGVIPEGYGAGVVMLWDQGTWEPLVDDVGEALRRGDLKLRLDGVKLKGSWALVRTRGSGDGRSWLLLKHKDEWAGPVDIAGFAPLSIKSGGDFTDILAQEAPDLWHSHRGGPSGQAHMLKVVERAVAISEENARAAGQQPRAPAPARRPASKKAGAAPARTAARTRPAAGSGGTATKAASSTARSTPRTPGASGRGARSRATRSRPR
jgi:bifunctional non-homologous end joining protein LigD